MNENLPSIDLLELHRQRHYDTSFHHIVVVGEWVEWHPSWIPIYTASTPPKKNCHRWGPMPEDILRPNFQHA
jgi:hypothetical protein